MKKIRWQLVIILLTGMVVGLLLLSEQNTQQPLTAQPIEGGTYTEALIGNIQRLNPLLDYNNPVDQDVDHLIFSGLLRFDDRGIAYPELAKAWGVSKDGLVYNVTLKENLKWQDGQPVTTRDIIFTIDLMREGNDIIPQDIRDLWEGVEAVALSDDTIQFRLQESFAPFPDYLTFGVLPEHLLANLSFEELVDASFNMQPVGTGPYRFESLIVENGQIIGLHLKANENYYSRAPYIQDVYFRYYPDGYNAYSAYLAGKVQGISKIPEDILPDVLADPNLALYTGRLPELNMVMFNLNDSAVPFFQDAEIRKALLMGLNRNWMVNNLLNGQAILADNVILPGTWAYYDGNEKVGYDLDQASAVLKKAGYVLPETGGNVREKDGISLWI